MTTVYVFCPNSTDATSWYRGLGPLAELKKSHQSEVVFAFPNEVNWATLSVADIVFLQRPHRERDLEIVKRAKLQKIPVWIDMDDWLLDVPKYNPSFKHYNNETTKKVIAECVALADRVSVSTWDLRDRLAPLNENIVVVKNALNTKLFPLDKKITHDSQSRAILWRGSATHSKDLEVIAQQVVNLSLSPELKGWAWVFLGDRPWFTNLMPEKTTICLDAMDVLDYHQFLESLNPAVMIVPLAENDFNRAKSNCAWLEGSYAGAACLVPDNMDEWKLPGMTPFKPAFLEDAIRFMTSNPHTRANLANQSRAYIKEHLTLERQNLERWRIVTELNPL